jgi:hypothetical protein
MANNIVNDPLGTAEKVVTSQGIPSETGQTSLTSGSQA